MKATDGAASAMEAIARWSSRMIDAPSALRVDLNRKGLEALCLALGAVRGLQFGFRDGDATAVVEAEWKAPDLPSAIGAEYTEAEAGGLFSLLRSENIIACSVDGVDAELAPLREILKAERLVADLIVPVQHDGLLVRAIVIDFAQPPTVDVDMLRRIGETMGEVLAASERRTRLDDAWRERLQTEAHKQKLQSLGTMVGGILHDVNNVFQVVTGMSELLLDEPRSSVQRRMVGDIQSAVSRGGELCRRVLLFSRQDVRPSQSFEIGTQLQAMTTLLRTAIPEDRVLIVDIEPSDRTVNIPLVELEHAVINLCNNAVDATRAGDRIDITFAIDDAGWGTIVVSDTGEGMDPATLERAQEAFFTTKPAGAGTGLGLAMVQRAIAQAGGTFVLESELGTGTTASLRMPTAAPGAPTDSALPAVERGSETLLLVEDDAMILRVTASALRRRGYTVITSGDGADALRHFDSDPDAIDLVITDVVMPKLGGRALHDAIAARGLPTPFLFATGYDAGQLSDRVRTVGPWDLLMKPYTSVQLQRAIRDLLDRDA